MVWVNCRLTHSWVFLYFVDKNRILLSVLRCLIDTCHKKGETSSFFPTVWLHCGACCERLIWSKTHLYDSTLFKNTGWRPAKALWAITVPTEWTGAWALQPWLPSANVQGCSSRAKSFVDDSSISLQWVSFVFKWGGYFSSREQILLLFVLFLFKWHVMVKSVVRISIWGV